MNTETVIILSIEEAKKLIPSEANTLKLAEKIKELNLAEEYALDYYGKNIGWPYKIMVKIDKNLYYVVWEIDPSYLDISRWFDDGGK